MAPYYHKKTVLSAGGLITIAIVAVTAITTTAAFAPPLSASNTDSRKHFHRTGQQQDKLLRQSFQLRARTRNQQEEHKEDIASRAARTASTSPAKGAFQRTWSKLAAATAVGMLSAMLSLASNPALAENELSARYGNAGIDTSLVDQTCLVDHCSLQAKACLQDDPSCRKGLTCTAKCLGDNACITGCMARYGNENLDHLLQCTIEDHECIKVAILPGGADEYGQEPRSPAPTVSNFQVASMQGSWYKVVGYNPNYDCYACQRNSFQVDSHNKDMLQMDVEFSMPHLLPDGSPPPPSGMRESFWLQEPLDTTTVSSSTGLQSMALNDYHTHETMVFDQPQQQSFGKNMLTLNAGTEREASYSRTAHSEGEMFGLKFWENWYVIGENDKDAAQEFKFIHYNGKTRQNTYEGAFVYSRTKELSPESLKKVYEIAKNAGMDPNQFCKIRNGCFSDETIPKQPETGLGSPSNPFRGILASTRVSELLGVEPVAARDTIRRDAPTAKILTPEATVQPQLQRRWWHEVGDYLENPHRHFQAMDDLRLSVDWPEEIVVASSSK